MQRGRASARSRPPRKDRPMDFRDWSIARKLGAGFGLVVALFAAAIALTLVFSNSAQSTWKDTLRWNQASAAADLQIRGTMQQLAAQGLYVATADAKYRAEWEQGVRLGNQ